MKMKSLAAVLMVAILGLGACGDSTNSTSTVSESSPTVSIASESKTESTVESVPQTQESGSARVDETEYTGVVEDGIYVIEKCVTSEEELIVPDLINGAPVGVIQGNAFMDVPSRTIKLPDTVTVIGEAAFMHCENLETIDLGSGLLSIGISAFQGCPNLLTVSFPEGLKSIEGAIFMADDLIGEVYIPASATEIVSIGFTNTCPNLVVVTPAGSRAEEVAKEAGVPVKNV